MYGCDSIKAATAVVAWSLFWTVVLSSNTYALPIDYFGPGLLNETYGSTEAGVEQRCGAVISGRRTRHLTRGRCCPLVPTKVKLEWPEQRLAMTLMLSDKEMTLLDQLAETRGMSKTALVRQALRLYQSVTERLENGEKVFVERPGSLEKTELMVL